MSTDTQDITGNIVAESAALPDEATLREALGRFIGDIEQIPPMYSAIKIGGKKLYELARRGESVERAPRKITVSAIDIAGRDGDDYILNISCSKGTYVRTMCSDIGEALGCGACMSSLRRTRAGVFSVDDAHSLADIEAAVREGRLSDIILPVDTLFASFPKLTVSQSAAKRLKNGNIIKISAEDGEYKVYSDSDEFLLLGRVEGEKLKTIKSFYEVS